jgi:hypothetical protein
MIKFTTTDYVVNVFESHFSSEIRNQHRWNYVSIRI